MKNEERFRKAIRSAYLPVYRLAKLNKLAPGGILQIHLLQKLVGYCFQSIFRPHLHSNQNLDAVVIQACKASINLA